MWAIVLALVIGAVGGASGVVLYLEERKRYWTTRWEREDRYLHRYDWGEK